LTGQGRRKLFSKERPEEIFKFRVSEMPFPGLWERFDRNMIVRKQRFSMSKFTRKYGPGCKVLFLRGELFVVNGSCAEMKAEHLRKFRKFGVSRWSEMAFSEFSLARPNT
jgi:hypothetical protein